MLTCTKWKQQKLCCTSMTKAFVSHLEEKTRTSGLWWNYGEMETLSVWLGGCLLEITNKDFSKVSFWFMDVKYTLISYSFGEYRFPRSHLPYPMSFNKGRFQLNGFNNMHEWIGIFLKIENCSRDFFPLVILFLLLASNQWPIAFLMLSPQSRWKSETLQGIRLNFLLDCPFVPAQKLIQKIKIMFTE